MSSDQLGDSGVYRKILVPIDGSPLSLAALDYATSLAARAGAEIFLLHVSEPAGKEQESLHQAYLEKLSERARGCIREIRGDGALERCVHTVMVVRPLTGQALHFHEVNIEDASDRKIHVMTVMGPTTEQITSYAEDEGMDLIVMGTHGRSEARHWPVDSVAMSVARCSMAPVRLIRVAKPDQEVCNEWPDQRIVVLLDGSEAAEQSLPYAIEHAKLCGADMNILTVWGPSPVPDYPGADQPLTLEEHKQRALEHGQSKNKTYLEGLAQRLAKAGVKARALSILGDPSEEIVKYVTDNEFDLVVMTTHARCGEGLWPIGSTTDKVLHRTSNPILLVHPK
jgi:nucleotide-binding universal stress UspA family protein